MDASNSPVPQGAPAEVQQQLQSMRRQLEFAQYLGLALAVAVGLLVYRLDQIQKRSAEAQLPLTQKLLDDQTRMGRSVGELQKYAASHPDYAAILKKYGVAPIVATNAVAAPTPAPAAPAKR
ncbi:MAG: hypothetical protein DVB31_05875 [Verrucomicrobia bacterium]|nr:MAG: hypothetical protein DVB31_05875 [Verrucomicrobiota bacterium]